MLACRTRDAGSGARVAVGSGGGSQCRDKHPGHGRGPLFGRKARRWRLGDIIRRRQQVRDLLGYAGRAQLSLVLGDDCLLEDHEHNQSSRRVRREESSWEKDLYSPTFTAGSAGRTVNVACDTTKATRTIACAFPPKGPVASGNLGEPGYCTWGAYAKWRTATGYYPNIGGNAIQMDNNALAKGFRVWAVPHARAMVVFNRNTFGHVGWVTKVYKNSAGKVVFDFWDMNGGADPDGDGVTPDFNKFVKRVGKVWDSTQRFILAPT